MRPFSAPPLRRTQVFECLNVATQSMCASLLGAGAVASARAVLQRALFVATAVGLLAGAFVQIAQAPLISFFSTDAAVVAVAAGALPLVAFLLPLDAAASIMDGGLLAASQTDALSIIQVSCSLLQYGMLLWVAANGVAGVLSVWAVLKLLSLARFVGGYYVHFLSPFSAYAPAEAALAPAALAVGGAAGTTAAGVADGL